MALAGVLLLLLAAPIDLARVRIVDLSHAYDARTLYWPTSPSRFERRSLSHGKTDAGYFSEVGQMLVGPSSCGEDDLSIRIVSGVATVRLCRDFSSAGIGQDARAQSAFEATLKQFPTIQTVILLFSVVYVVINLLIDISYTIFDPRIRY